MESQADEAQHHAIDRSERIAHAGAWTIFSGLILEIGLVVVEGRPGWQTVWQIGADVLIALGVVFELHYAAASAQLDVTRIFEAFTEAAVQIAIRQKDLTLPNELVKGLSPNLYLFVGMKPWLSSLENPADPHDVHAPAY